MKKLDVEHYLDIYNPIARICNPCLPLLLLFPRSCANPFAFVL